MYLRLTSSLSTAVGWGRLCQSACLLDGLGFLLTMRNVGAEDLFTSGPLVDAVWRGAVRKQSRLVAYRLTHPTMVTPIGHGALPIDNCR